MTDAERDDYQSRRSAAMRREQAEGWFKGVCPAIYHPARTDWNHPGLAPYAAQIAAVRGWQAGRTPPGLLLAGDTFRGKTRALFALLHRLRVEELHHCAYFTAAGFFARLGEQVNYGRDDAREWIEGVARHPFFFLDDLGQEALAETRKEASRQWFFKFLDIRRGEELPLFITTNLTASAIADGKAQERLTADQRAHPLLSRLLDLCEPVKF